jgi:hypothetical protein
VLVTSTVRDLVAGSGLSFEDRGYQSLKDCRRTSASSPRPTLREANSENGGAGVQFATPSFPNGQGAVTYDNGSSRKFRRVLCRPVTLSRKALHSSALWHLLDLAHLAQW